LVKDVNDDLTADSNTMLNRWKNYFCQLLNVFGVNNVRQTDAAEPLEPEPVSAEVEAVIQKLKRYISCGTNQFLAEYTKQEVIHYVLRCINISTL
jgi:hypothetical protein